MCALPDLHKNPATTAEIYERTAEVPREAIGRSASHDIPK